MSKQKDIRKSLAKALTTPVTDSVREEIQSVLNVNADKLTAAEAIAYAQVAKAIKGDKNAFEAVAEATAEAKEEAGGFKVEIRVVE